MLSPKLQFTMNIKDIPEANRELERISEIPPIMHLTYEGHHLKKTFKKIEKTSEKHVTRGTKVVEKTQEEVLDKVEKIEIPK